MWTQDVYECWTMSPTWSLAAALLALVPLASVVVLGFWRAWRRAAVAATAEASVEPRPVLAEGRDLVLAGRVRLLDDADVAVRISVRQRGSEHESSGAWSYRWEEIDREIVVHPFVLELANGEQVVVYPPANVDVADALDQKVVIKRDERVMSAELVPGEAIFARGRLARQGRARAGEGYRDGTFGWSLHPANGHMLLSSEPMGSGLRKRARFHRRFAWFALAVLAATQLTLVSFYGRRAGVARAAPVEELRHEDATDDDGDPVHTYEVRVRGRWIEVALVDWIALGGHLDRAPEPPMIVPIRYASDGNWNLGSEPVIAWWHGVLVVVLAGGAVLAYPLIRRATRPWFRRRAQESGSGRLPGPT